MGDFELVVAIDRGESIVMPLEGDRTELPEPIGTSVAEFSLLSGMQLLDEDELAGPSDLLASLLETETPTPVAATPAVAPPVTPVARPKPVPVPAPVPAAAPYVAPARVPNHAKGPKAVQITADDLLDTFLDGAGLSRADLDPDIDPAEILQNAGQVLREFVTGLGRMLKSRSNLKGTFRLDQTTMLPRQNNPMKFAQHDNDSLRQLLVGREGEYLGPRDAAREVCRDLVFHQDALLDAMHAAFAEFADRFDPDELIRAFRTDQNSRPFLGFLERLKYWQMYCDLYPVLTERGESRFPQLFAEEFVRTYERQMGEYRRVESVPNLKNTVRLGPRHAVPPPLPSAPEPAPVPVIDPAVSTLPGIDDALGADLGDVGNNLRDIVDDEVPSIVFDDSFAELFDDEDART
jgi:type VI secretion system FHA domain protein